MVAFVIRIFHYITLTDKNKVIIIIMIIIIVIIIIVIIIIFFFFYKKDQKVDKKNKNYLKIIIQTDKKLLLKFWLAHFPM